MCYALTIVPRGLAADKLFLTLVTGPGAANVLPHSCALRPCGGKKKSHISIWPRHGNVIPHTRVRHSLAAEKLMPILATCPGAANVLPHTNVRHGLAADKLFFTLVTGPDAANVLPNTDVRHGLAAGKLFLG